MNIPKMILFAALLIFGRCNNYGLLEKLEDPGGNANKLYAFVSSVTTVGNMSGFSNGSCGSLTSLERADCGCTDLAKAAGLQNSSSTKFVAWLSTNMSEMKCRITGGMGAGTCSPSGGKAWYNTKGELIASNIPDLLDQTLTNAIKYTEQGVLSPQATAWTGTNAPGDTADPGGASPTTKHCSTWGDGSSGTAVAGSIFTNGVNWSNNLALENCNTSHPVYCFAISQ